jgi:hypothetical protein
MIRTTWEFCLPANEVSYSGQISYNQFTPKEIFLLIITGSTSVYSWLYKPYAYNYLRFSASGFWIFRNFWDVSLSLGTLPFGENDYFVLNTPAVMQNGRRLVTPNWREVLTAGKNFFSVMIFLALCFIFQKNMIITGMNWVFAIASAIKYQWK